MTNRLSLAERFWDQQALSPGFINSLQAAGGLEGDNTNSAAPNPLAAIPYLFCTHTNGNPEILRLIMEAWNLLRRAARILDDFEDGDAAKSENNSLQLNAATGLIFTANMLLSNLEAQGCDAETATSIRQKFGAVLLKTCDGQHNDISLKRPSLEQRWQITKDKSGRFLGLIIWASVRLGTQANETLNLYQSFGETLGIIDQIHDDLIDLWSNNHQASDLTRPEHWSLPVAYAFSVLPQPLGAQLQFHLQQAHCSTEHEQSARQLILESGAQLYLTVQLTMFCQRARHLISQMQIPTASQHKLTKLVDQLQTIN